MNTSSFDFDPGALLVSCTCLATAFVLGALIGLERQWRQRTAGLRTNVLVSVGAVRVISYVVSGIGFLGAG